MDMTVGVRLDWEPGVALFVVLDEIELLSLLEFRKFVSFFVCLLLFMQK